MNGQAQPLEGEVLIDMRVSIGVANLFLEGLGKLPIDRAGGVHASLRETIDAAISRDIANRAAARQAASSPPPPPPPAGEGTVQ